jgi:PKD repeat protein
MYGRQVAELGEPTTLLITEEQVAGQAPVARVDVSQDGRSVTVDAGSSTDADGTVADFLWEFGDGTTATGPRVTHRYESAGEYRITLAVKDDSGHEAFAATEGAITIPRYEFSGFQSPVEAQPALNTARAGRSIPVKFGLGGDHGLDILPPGSPSSARIDCQAATTLSEVEGTTTAGASSLSYDEQSGTYTYVWKTSSSWVGTCRRFTLALDDGSSYDADFFFKP